MIHPVQSERQIEPQSIAAARFGTMLQLQAGGQIRGVSYSDT